jgi:hypothetical protein
VKAERADVKRTGTGEYEVTLHVVARKLRADSSGKETEVPMDDLIEIGVFAADSGQGSGAPLHLERHRIHSGKQALRIIVSKAPARAGIDPYRRLIDRNGDDNMSDVHADVVSATTRPRP